jgi:hypothetical protein
MTHAPAKAGSIAEAVPVIALIASTFLAAIFPSLRRRTCRQVMRHDYYIPGQLEPEIIFRKQRFDALSDYVTARHGWLTSIAGAPQVTMENLMVRAYPMISAGSSTLSRRLARASASWPPGSWRTSTTLPTAPRCSSPRTRP